MRKCILRCTWKSDGLQVKNDDGSLIEGTLFYSDADFTTLQQKPRFNVFLLPWAHRQEVAGLYSKQN